MHVFRRPARRLATESLLLRNRFTVAEIKHQIRPIYCYLEVHSNSTYSRMFSKGKINLHMCCMYFGRIMKDGNINLLQDAMTRRFGLCKML